MKEKFEQLAVIVRVLVCCVAFILTVMFMQNFEVHFNDRVDICDGYDYNSRLINAGILIEKKHTAHYLFSIEVEK